MALKTGIAPMQLLETPPEIFDHMVRYTLGRGMETKSDWERLNEEIL
jgi:hypothetical protein